MVFIKGMLSRLICCISIHIQIVVMVTQTHNLVLVSTRPVSMVVTTIHIQDVKRGIQLRMSTREIYRCPAYIIGAR